MEGLGVGRFLLLLFLLALPNTVFVLLLSDMAWGVPVYKVLLSNAAFVAGIACLAVAGGSIVLLYILSFEKWTNRTLQLTVCAAIYGFLSVGGFLIARMAPEAPMVVVLLQSVAVLLLVRCASMQVRPSSFGTGVAAALAMMAAVLFLLWIIWCATRLMGGEMHHLDSTRDAVLTSGLYGNFQVKLKVDTITIDPELDCSSSREHKRRIVNGALYSLSLVEQASVAHACSLLRTTTFLLWLSPLVAVCWNSLLACLVAITASAEKELSRLLRDVAIFVGLVASLTLVAYLASTVSAVDMQLANGIIAFFAAVVAASVLWVAVELWDELLHMVKESSKVKTVLGVTLRALDSDWFWSCGILALPLLLALDWMKMSVLRKSGYEVKGAWSPWVEAALASFRSKNLASIGTKMCILCEILFAATTGINKTLPVFLSWMNDLFSALDLWLVCLIHFLIGLVLFMSPSVPGLPVYLWGGVMIAARARSTPVGHVGGTVLACGVVYCLKMASVPAMYSLGYFMGRSLKIQQLVGVDKLPIKAVESILKRRGFSISKVAVLVGGPQWPIYVLSGILRISLPQIFLGGLPVAVFLLPCVIGGALLVPPVESTSSSSVDSKAQLYNALAQGFVALGLVVQSIVFFVACYYMQQVMFRDAEELAKPRKEHEAVVALTQQEVDYNAAYMEVTAWSELSCSQRSALLLAAPPMLLSVLFMAAADTVCFRPFATNGRIGDSIDNGGLDNNVLNAVLVPGAVAFVVFLVSIVAHIVFVKLAHAATRRHMQCQVLPEKCTVVASPPHERE